MTDRTLQAVTKDGHAVTVHYQGDKEILSDVWQKVLDGPVARLDKMKQELKPKGDNHG